MIQKLTPHHAMICAHLHKTSLPDDTLSILGNRFLILLYKMLLSLPDVHAYGFIYKNILIGFIVGTEDSSRLLKKFIIKNTFGILPIVFVNIIKKPQLAVRMIETFFYSTKLQHKVKAELLVIGVDSQFRQKGIGKKLVNHLTKSFAKHNVYTFYVNTYADNKAANTFYKSLGGVLQGSFHFYRKKWNSYLFLH